MSIQIPSVLTIFNYIIKKIDLTLLLTFFFLYFAIRPYIDYFKSRKYRAPGPVPWPFIGNHNVLIGNLANNKYNLSKKFGDICEIKMLGYRTLIIANPNYLKDLFSPSVYSPFLRRMPLAPGFKELGMDKEGLLFNLDIPTWRHNRKFFQQSLSPPSFIESSTKYTRECCDEMMTYWEDVKCDQVIRLDEWYRAFTSDIMGLVASGSKEESLKIQHRKVFGNLGKYKEDVNQLSRGEQYRRLRSDYAEAIAFFVFLPKFVWGLPWIRTKCQYFRNKLASLTEFELRFIKERKAEVKAINEQQRIQMGLDLNNKVKADFLTMILTMNEDLDPSPESIKQSIREMFSAGTGTTTTTLCAVAYLLAKHPEVEKRMVEEILNVVGSTKRVDSSDLSKLKYIECVLYETMRLFPAVPLTPRFTPEISTKIGDYDFPPNTLFIINLGYIQRDSRYFKDPDVFNPDRFVGKWQDKIQPHAFSPFGHGMRSCPGKHFAMTEMKVILAAIYRNFTFKLVNPKEPLHLKFSLVNDITKLDVYLEKRKK